MTNQEIKDIIQNATTKQDLQPLHDFHNQLKARETKVSQILRLLETRINNSNELAEFNDQQI